MSLRNKLSEITETLQIADHPASIESLRSDYTHSIQVVESEHPIDRYTCCVYAFHLVEDPIYLGVASYGLGKTFAGAEFINFLLQNQLLLPRKSAPVLGDLVLYFEANEFRHVGIVAAENLIISKWGSGWLYKHRLWEVPSQYGQDVKYFIGLDQDSSFNLFMEFAKNKGFTFGDLGHG